MRPWLACLAANALFIAAASLSACGGIGGEDGGSQGAPCISDRDCKGDRICAPSGRCVDPNPSLDAAGGARDAIARDTAGSDAQEIDAASYPDAMAPEDTGDAGASLLDAASDGGSTDGGARNTDASAPDAASDGSVDGGSSEAGAGSTDASSLDATSDGGMDGGAIEAGPGNADASALDAVADGGVDSGSADAGAGTIDASVLDAAADGGSADAAGAADAVPLDTGLGDAGPAPDATPMYGLRVELTWSGMSDFDLHLHDQNATPWFGQGDDCYYAERQPQWNTAEPAGSGENPVLENDNTVGFGPEFDHIVAPAIGKTYTIAAHNYRAGAGQTATIQIFCGGGTVPTRTLTSSAVQGTSAGNCTDATFWKAASVTFTSSAACTITPLDIYMTSQAACMGF